MVQENKSFNTVKFLNITEISFITKTKKKEFEVKSPYYDSAIGCHKYWSVYYVEEGELEIRCDGKALRLKEGEILYIEPYATHAVFMGRDDLSYKFDFVANSSVLDCLAGKVLTLPVELRGVVAQVYNEALNALLSHNVHYPNNISFTESVEKNTAKPYWQQFICMHIEHISLCLTRENIDEDSLLNKRREKDKDVLMVDIVKFLENNIYGKLSLQDICNEFSYSKSSLMKKFRQTFNCGIMENYNYHKINEAMRLIHDKRLNFTQIADLLCFSNERNFARTFRKHADCLPGEYREKLKNNEDIEL